LSLFETINIHPLLYLRYKSVTYKIIYVFFYLGASVFGMSDSLSS